MELASQLFCLLGVSLNNPFDWDISCLCNGSRAALYSSVDAFSLLVFPFQGERNFFPGDFVFDTELEVVDIDATTGLLFIPRAISFALDLVIYILECRKL